MTEKESGRLRIGFGRYEWSRSPDVDPRVDRLAIAIERMDALTVDAAAVLDWAAGLPYPWCAPRQLAAVPPPLDELAVLVDRAAQIAN